MPTNLFQRETNDHEERIHRSFRILYDANDFLAGVLFTIGSILFFGESTQHAATWLFLIGSVQFMFRPGIKVLRDVKILRHRQGKAKGQRRRP